MRNVTITLSEELARRSRVEAARQGKSLSKFIAETLQQRVGAAPKMGQKEAMERFLAGPDLSLLDENGTPPTRDEIYRL